MYHYFAIKKSLQTEFNSSANKIWIGQDVAVGGGDSKYNTKLAGKRFFEYNMVI